MKKILLLTAVAGLLAACQPADQDQGGTGTDYRSEEGASGTGMSTNQPQTPPSSTQPQSQPQTQQTPSGGTSEGQGTQGGSSSEDNTTGGTTGGNETR